MKMSAKKNESTSSTRTQTKRDNYLRGNLLPEKWKREQLEKKREKMVRKIDNYAEAKRWLKQTIWVRNTYTRFGCERHTHDLGAKDIHTIWVRNTYTRNTYTRFWTIWVRNPTALKSADVATSDWSVMMTCYHVIGGKSVFREIPVQFSQPPLKNGCENH